MVQDPASFISSIQRRRFGRQDCCLIVYHAYRPLVEYVEDVREGGREDKELLTLSWRLVNDSLRTDAALLFPPFQVVLSLSLLG